MTPAISFRNVNKYFMRGTPNQVKALNGVNLDIAPGQFVTVIGSNGAGKSTMLKCLSGHVVPDEGSVVLRGATSPACRSTSGRRPSVASRRTRMKAPVR